MHPLLESSSSAGEMSNSLSMSNTVDPTEPKVYKVCDLLLLGPKPSTHVQLAPETGIVDPPENTKTGKTGSKVCYP